MPARRNNTVVRAANAVDAAKFFLPIYLGLGVGRSVRKVHELVRAMGITVSVKTLNRYSVLGGWVEAARKFDAERAAEGMGLTIDQVMANDARQVQLGRLLQETAISEVAKRTRLGERAQPGTLSEIARLADVGVKIERLASGQATEVRQVLVDVYQLMTVEVAGLWRESFDASRAIYQEQVAEDDVLHARAYQNAGRLFGEGVDRLVGAHFRTLGIDVAIGPDGDTQTVEEDDDD